MRWGNPAHASARKDLYFGHQRPGTSRSARFRHRGRAFDAADLFEMRNQYQTVELHNRQCQKQIDAALQHAEGFVKATTISASLPVAVQGPGMPQWAVIGWPGQIGQGSPAASSQTMNTKWRSGASGCAKSIQDFRALIVGIVPFVAQQRDGMRMDFAMRIGTAAEGTEITGAMTVEDCLGHD
jgi:hypothetical protein